MIMQNPVTRVGDLLEHFKGSVLTPETTFNIMDRICRAATTYIDTLDDPNIQHLQGDALVLLREACEVLTSKFEPE